eukprot:Skav204498  [mRNA]  locus=scaffold1457:171831:175708:+ [translate_table: standard]
METEGSNPRQMLASSFPRTQLLLIVQLPSLGVAAMAAVEPGGSRAPLHVVNTEVFVGTTESSRTLEDPVLEPVAVLAFCHIYRFT